VVNQGKHTGFWLFHRFYYERCNEMKPELIKLWLLCMNRANWEQNEVNLEGINKPIKLQPGQFITSRDKLHAEYHGYKKGHQRRHPSAWTLWQWLSSKLASKHELLSIKSTNKYSIITIANWPSEQSYWQKPSSNMSSKTPQTVHREEIISSLIREEVTGTKICKLCKREFVPRIDWHTTCDQCYRPREEKSGARPELLNKRCEVCGYTASNVIDGLCWQCADKRLIQ